MSTPATTNSKPEVSPPEPGLRLAARSGLDVMLSDAVLESGSVGRFLKPRTAGRTILGLARHPRRAAADAGSFSAELARVAAGNSDTSPAKGDRRFSERAWQDNWLLRRVMQSYLATCETVDRLISDAGLDWRTERQARFAASNVLDALAPTNFPWSNPAVLKESIDAGGANLVRGGRRFVRDMTRPPHLPASVDVTKFEVGGNLAVTPGSVVLRTDVFELIQYRPVTEQVHEVPLLFVPPTINKYYIARPRARTQHGGVPARPAATGVHDLLAQPRRRAGPLRPRHLRRRRCSTARDAVAGSPARAGRRRASRPARAASSPRWCRAPGAIGQQDQFATLTLMVRRAGPGAGGNGRRHSPDEELAAAAVAESGPRATSTVGRWPACSPGCGRTT